LEWGGDSIEKPEDCNPIDITTGANAIDITPKGEKPRKVHSTKIELYVGDAIEYLVNVHPAILIEKNSGSFTVNGEDIEDGIENTKGFEKRGIIDKYKLLKTGLYKIEFTPKDKPPFKFEFTVKPPPPFLENLVAINQGKSLLLKNWQGRETIWSKKTGYDYTLIPNTTNVFNITLGGWQYNRNNTTNYKGCWINPIHKINPINKDKITIGYIVYDNLDNKDETTIIWNGSIDFFVLAEKKDSVEWLTLLSPKLEVNDIDFSNNLELKESNHGAKTWYYHNLKDNNDFTPPNPNVPKMVWNMDTKKFNMKMVDDDPDAWMFIPRPNEDFDIEELQFIDKHGRLSWTLQLPELGAK